MRVLSCVFVGILSASLAGAQESTAPEAPLDEVVVTGEYPGPGMWKVTRPENPGGHVLWIVGDPGQLPKGLRWKSKEIDAIAMSSQEILYEAGLSLTTDKKVGLLRGLTLVRAALKARKNPDDAKLVDVLPPDVYSRWQVQKKVYLGRDDGVESWRPMFVAEKLQEAAFEKLAFSPRDAVSGKVYELASKQKIKQTWPHITYTFKRSEIRDRMKAFSREALTDVECLRVTLDLVEALGQRDQESARLKAWARGDLAALRALPERPDPDLACGMALMGSEQARDLVPDNVRELVQAKWLEAAEASLAANQSTLAVMPFGKLTRKDGYLDLLRQKGYVVEEPS